MKLGVVDYGAGNLRSVSNALTHVGCSHTICRTPDELREADRIILPGVGHFGAAMQAIEGNMLASTLVRQVEDGVPLLGICLGLQLLFESSEEAPDVPGLGLLPGSVRRLHTDIVPHMGWNRLGFRRENPLTEGLPDVVYCYFANSFAGAPSNPDVVVADTSQDEDVFPAIVGRGRIVATQFHPEKSGPAGLAMLRNFVQC